MASEDTQYRAGSSGGPGRPKGSKNKITKAYLDTIVEAFDECGKEVVDRLIEKRPDVFIKLVADLVPKNMDINHSGNLNVSVIAYEDDTE